MSEQQSGWPTPQQQASKYAWKRLNYGDRNSTASYTASNAVATLTHMKAQIDVVIRSIRHMRPGDLIDS